MVRHIFLTLVGILGLVIYVYNLVQLERTKNQLDNPMYVKTRRRECGLWIVIFFCIMLDHIEPVFRMIFG